MTVRGERVYRRLLRLYPEAFRSRFEPEMLALFGARTDAASTRQFGLLRFWILVLDDLVRSAFAERFPGLANAAVHSIPRSMPGQEAYANYRVVTPDYFRTLNIPILRGRNFTAQDARLAVPLIRWFPQQPLPPRFNEPQAIPTAVINESMARTYWPADDPIGRRFTVLFAPMITVVGVVRDSRNQALSDAPVPEFYLSADQEPQTRMTLLVASTAPGAGSSESALPASIRAQLASIDRDLPVGRVRTLADILDTNLALHRAITASERMRRQPKPRQYRHVVCIGIRSSCWRQVQSPDC
jgi:hypothetical protein